MDIEIDVNSSSWDKEVERKNYWTKIVGPETIQKARDGILDLRIGPEKIISSNWIKYIKSPVLALAAGGGQQGPILSAANFDTTVFDLSKKQLEQDQIAAKEYGLNIKTVWGDMSNLAVFEDEAFNTIINPASLNFVKDLTQVYNEVHRVLTPGGAFMFNIANPIMYMFDPKKMDKNKLKVKYTIPFDATIAHSKKQLDKMIKENDTVEFSHTLEEVFGSLCKTGFTIHDMYSEASSFDMIDSFIHDCYLTILAIKG